MAKDKLLSSVIGDKYANFLNMFGLKIIAVFWVTRPYQVNCSDPPNFVCISELFLKKWHKQLWGIFIIKIKMLITINLTLKYFNWLPQTNLSY